VKVEFTENNELEDGQTIKENVDPNTEMKSWMVNYVGEKNNPKDDQVTVGMIVDTMAKEFPEFLMAIAEENWIRGYHQALEDVSEGERLHHEASLDSPNEEKEKVDGKLHKGN
jgi:hypothetical protein